MTADGYPTGVELIAAERQRQIEVEGWTSEHDDRHSREEIAQAAAIYAMPARIREGTTMLLLWPWDFKWLKPRDTPQGSRDAGTIQETTEWRNGRIQTLVKAGALIAAEIDRLQRRVSRGDC